MKKEPFNLAYLYRLVLTFWLAIFCNWFFYCPYNYAQAQTQADTLVVDSTSLVGRYHNLGIGFAGIRYRDLATSPLFYGGAALNTTSGWWWLRENRETLFQIDGLFGALAAFTPESEYFQPSTTAFVISSSLYVHHLREVPALRFWGTEVRLGGALQTTWNLRPNPSLSNNGFGVEGLAHLMFAAKATKDISRKHTVVHDLWLFKLRLKPLRRNISLQFNTGLLNLNYRPGYAYSNVPPFDGTATNPVTFLLDGHRWSLNGWRASTQLAYTTYRPNGNGHRWAYVWDAYHAPGRYEAFQMATHSFQYTLMFKSK